jgi:hypothetical protein
VNYLVGRGGIVLPHQRREGLVALRLQEMTHGTHVLELENTERNDQVCSQTNLSSKVAAQGVCGGRLRVHAGDGVDVGNVQLKNNDDDMAETFGKVVVV